jgi:hypothetical protein
MVITPGFGRGMSALRTPRSLLATLALAGLVGAALVAAGPANAATTTSDAMVTDSSTGDDYSDVAPVASIALSAPSSSQIDMNGSSPANAQSLTFSLTAPVGQNLAVGTYSVAATADATNAGLTAPCGAATGSGTITVQELTWDPGHTVVTAFAASYTFICSDVATTVWGLVRYHSATPFLALVATPQAYQWGAMLVKVVRQLTLTNVGTLPTTLGAPSLTGIDAASFVIGTNSCPATLAAGATCTIEVDALAMRSATVIADVVVPDSSARGFRKTQVSFDAYPNLNGRFRPATQQWRLVDTRSGGITFDHNNQGGGPIGAGGTRSFFVSHNATIQGNGTDDAVVLNITVVSPTASGYMTVFPFNSARPAVSSINFAAGQTIANQVTVRLDSSRRIALFNHAGSVNVVVDLVGFYPDAVSPDAGNGFTFRPQQPYRLYDSRTAGAKLGPGRALQWTTVPGVRAIALNITVTGATAAGYVSAWTGPSNPAPLASTLDFRAGHTVSNMTVVGTNDYDSGAGYLEVGNFSSQGIDLIVDVVGYYDTSELGLHLVPTNPARIVDSRVGLGLSQALGQGVWADVTATVTDPLTRALVMNVTGLAGAHDTYLTLWASGATRPPVSNLDPPAASQVASMAMVGLSADDRFSVYNNAGTTNVLADLAGTLFGPPLSLSGGAAVRALAQDFSPPTEVSVKAG